MNKKITNNDFIEFLIKIQNKFNLSTFFEKELLNKKINNEKEWISILEKIINNSTSFKPSFSSNLNKNIYPKEINNYKIEIIDTLYGKKTKNTVLLYGKPGTGKTSFIEEIINNLKQHNKDFSFLKIKASEILDSKLGLSIKNLNNIFNFNSKRYNLYYIDEVETLFGKRFNDKDINEINRLITEFMQIIDELPENIILIAATNLKNQIDEALLRRFKLKINFDIYSSNDLIHLIKKQLIIKNLSKNINSDTKKNQLFSKKFFDFLYNEIFINMSPFEIKSKIQDSNDLIEIIFDKNLFILNKNRIKINLNNKNLKIFYDWKNKYKMSLKDLEIYISNKFTKKTREKISKEINGKNYE
ncbi:Proteasomal ATPase [Candidatus Hepatoplasma crinochetorum Av]|uniref:Proteasomal ATPase n=1 Tax=Candidatus Hepatoplasma crinochetorum Av TaxID=1427984 RepID=W8GJ31_9MOLU|nr:ATP-binding protein [Candidatus Hepatoplasma crinochetorum]AHK22252.1 Proteasomal ATPase [Candidatus Hepatoplasma crinochetorum Av]